MLRCPSTWSKSSKRRMGTISGPCALQAQRCAPRCALFDVTDASAAQKIDALKTELGSIADLATVTGDEWQDEDLTGEEKRALEDAGLLPGPPGSKKRKRAGPKHIVFVENEEQGALAPVSQ